VEQLAVVGLALLLGLVGLAVHVLWVVSIVVMAILFGLIASGLRGDTDRGVVSEVVSEVKIMAEEIAQGPDSTTLENNEPADEPEAGE